MLELILHDGHRETIDASNMTRCAKTEVLNRCRVLWKPKLFKNGTVVDDENKRKLGIVQVKTKATDDQDTLYLAMDMNSGVVEEITSMGHTVASANDWEQLPIVKDDFVVYAGAVWKVIGVCSPIIVGQKLRVGIRNKGKGNCRCEAVVLDLESFKPYATESELRVNYLTEYKNKELVKAFLLDWETQRLKDVCVLISKAKGDATESEKVGGLEKMRSVVEQMNAGENVSEELTRNTELNSRLDYAWMCLRAYSVAKDCSSSRQTFLKKWNTLASGEWNAETAWERTWFGKLITKAPLLGLLTLAEAERYRTLLELAIEFLNFDGSTWDTSRIAAEGSGSAVFGSPEELLELEIGGDSPNNNFAEELALFKLPIFDGSTRITAEEPSSAAAAAASRSAWTPAQAVGLDNQNNDNNSNEVSDALVGDFANCHLDLKHDFFRLIVSRFYCAKPSELAR